MNDYAISRRILDGTVFLRAKGVNPARRFLPLRLLGRLPPEPVAPFISGRRPRTLNKDRHVIRIFEAVAERAPPVGEMVVMGIGGGVRHHMDERLRFVARLLEGEQ